MSVVRAIAISVLVFTSSAAAAEPSKHDTYQFIREKMVFSTEDSRGHESWYNITQSNAFCTLIHSFDFYPSGGEKQRTEQQTIDLKEIDPSEVKYIKSQGLYRVELTVREKRNMIKYKIIYSDYYMKSHPEENKLNTSSTFKFFMPVGNQRDAEKVSKALVHLISLCGGKSELF